MTHPSKWCILSCWINLGNLFRWIVAWEREKKKEREVSVDGTESETEWEREIEREKWWSRSNFRWCRSRKKCQTSRLTQFNAFIVCFTISPIQRHNSIHVSKKCDWSCVHNSVVKWVRYKANWASVRMRSSACILIANVCAWCIHWYTLLSFSPCVCVSESVLFGVTETTANRNTNQNKQLSRLCALFTNIGLLFASPFQYHPLFVKRKNKFKRRKNWKQNIRYQKYYWFWFIQ